MTPSDWLIVLCIVLTILNFYMFRMYHHYRSQVKQRGSFRRWPIKEVGLPDVDPIFETNEFGPTIDTSVQFIGRGHLNVPGGTSDSEAWVLSVLAKKAKSIFEFGTCTGKTAYLMAQNSPADARVFTLTLPPDQVKDYEADFIDNKNESRNAVKESRFTHFLYTGTSVEKKITQIFADSKHFDEGPYEKKIDLIFVDGSHALSYVNSDSQKAFKMVSPGGMILWHDYRGPNQNEDVFKGLNQIAKEKKLAHIMGTSFVIFRNNS